MNINDYKDGNGNVLVSENLITALVGGVNGETGTTASGNTYLKLENGLMIVTGTITGLAPDTAAGNLFQSEIGTWLYQVAFLSPPAVSVNVNGNFRWCNAKSGLVAGEIRVFSQTTSSVAQDIYCMAIGRWK